MRGEKFEYPYLPKANVGVTRAADYGALLERAAA